MSINVILVVKEICNKNIGLSIIRVFRPPPTSSARLSKNKRKDKLTFLSYPFIPIDKPITPTIHSHLQLIFLLSAHDPRLALCLRINKKRITRCLGNDDAVLNRELVTW